MYSKQKRYLAAFFFAIGVYTTVTGSISVAVFDIRFGARYLPYIYILFPFINAIFSIVYIKKLPSLNKRQLFKYFMAAVIILHILGFLILKGAFGYKLLYAALLLVTLLFEENFILLGMMIVQEVSDIESIKRLLPFTSASAITGSIAAALAVNSISYVLRTEYMFLAVLVFVPIIGYAADVLLRKYRIVTEDYQTGRNGSFSETFKYIRENSFYFLLILLPAVVGIAFNINDYLYNVKASAILGSETGMVRFIGATASFRYAFALLVELLLFVRIVTRLGSFNSVKLVLVSSLLGTGLILYNGGELAAILVSKVVFSVLVMQLNLSVMQVMMSPVDRRYKDNLIILTDIVVSFTGYVLAGIISLLHSGNILDTGFISIVSAVVCIIMLVLWTMKQSSFVSALERNINLPDEGIRRLLGKTGVSGLFGHACEKIKYGSPSEIIIALDLLKYGEADRSAELLKDAFVAGSTEVRMKIIDLLMEKGNYRTIISDLFKHMDDEVLHYTLVQLYVHYREVSSSGVFETTCNKGRSVDKARMKNMALWMYGYLFEGKKDNYKLILIGLDKSGKSDDYAMALQIMKSFAGIEDEVNGIFLRRFVEKLRGYRTLLRDMVELCWIYEDRTLSCPFYLSQVFSVEYDYDIMEQVYSFYNAEEIISRFQGNKLLIPGTYTLYAAMRLGRKRALEYSETFARVVGALHGIVAEKAIISKSNHPAAELLVEEVNRLMVSVSAVAVNYLFVAYGIPPLKDIHKNLLSEGKRYLVCEMVRNSLPMKASAEILAVLYGDARETDERCIYPVLRVGDRNSTMEKLYRYVGGERTDLQFSREIDHMSSLKSVSMFKGLDVEALRQLIAISKYRNFEKGSVIIQKGGIGDSFFVLLQGQAGVFPDESGECIAIVEKGGILGELAVIDKGIRTATVKTLCSCVLLEFEGNDFNALLMRNTEVCFWVVTTLVERIRSMSNKKFDKKRGIMYH